MGDRFTSRVPSDIQQHISKTMTEADTYISEYNFLWIVEEVRVFNFPDNMKLISRRT